MKYNKKGGKLQPTPYSQYPLSAATYRSSALKNQDRMNDDQASLNNQHGGSGTTGRSKTVTVPQFRPPGGNEVGPVNSNSSSVDGNATSIQSTNDAMNDCYATNSCGITGGVNRKRTNKKKRRTNKKKRRTNKNKRRTYYY